MKAWTAMKELTTGMVGVVMVLILTGCALGNTQLEVTHSALEASSTAHEGTILVREFKDIREAGHRNMIGNKRNTYGMVLGGYITKDGSKLETLLTQHFVEALRGSGYKAVLQQADASGQPAQFDAVLNGEISDFWLDQYMMVWHSVDVKLTLKDRSEANVLWERKIHGERTNVLWLGLNSEIEKVIRQSMDVAISQTMKELAADEFPAAIKQTVKVSGL